MTQRPVVNGVLALAVAGAAVATWLLVRDPASGTAQASVRTSTVQRGSVLSSVSASGNVQAAKSFGVSFQANGTVTAILVKVGDAVRKGQTLARVDDASGVSSVRTAEAQLASAEANLQQTLEGTTSAERRQNRLSIRQAQDQLTSATESVASTRASNAASLAQLEDQVAQAKRGLVQARQQAKADTAAAAASVTQARTAIAQARSSNDVNDASLQSAVQQATQAVADAKQSAAMDIASAEAAVTQAQQQLQTDQAKYNLDAGALDGIFGETPGAKASREAASAAVNNDAAQIQQIREFQAENEPPYPGGYDSLALQQLQYRQTQDQAVLTALTTLLNDQLTLDKDTQAIEAAERTLASTKSKAEQSQRTAANQLEAARQNLDKSDVSNAQSLTSAQNQLRQALQSQTSTRLKNAQSIAAAQTQLDTAQQSLRSGVVKNQQALASAKGSVANARTSLASAKAGVEVKEATATPSAVAQAQASIVSARASLANAKVTLDQTILRAPADGVITAVNGSVGSSSGSSGSSASSSATTSATSSSSSSSSSSGFVSMIGNATLQVRAGFGEADAAKIAVGQPATITVSALPDTSLSAHVVLVDQTSTVVSNVVTYYVTLQLDRRVEGLKPGMTVTAQVIADKRDGVLHVPSAAVTGTGSNARVTVVAADGTQTTKTVVAGLVGDESTEIVSGLGAGDRVVTATAIATTTATGQSGSGNRSGSVGFPSGGGFSGGGGGIPGGGRLGG